MTILEQMTPELIKRATARGIEKGREERSKEIAKVLLSNGIDIKMVAKSTGQSVADIKKLFS